MAPSSGWYPDPAGSADLRNWDGQTWTRQTAPLPATPLPPPAGPALLAPPPIPRQAHAPTQEGFSPARALPGSLAGRVPARPYGVPRTRNTTFYGLLAGGVAVVVAAAFIIPQLMSSSHTHSSTSATAEQPLTTYTPAPQPTPIPSPDAGQGLSSGQLSLPAQFDGFPRITDARASKYESEMSQTWPVTGTRLLGIYGPATGEFNAMVAVTSLPLTPAGDRAAIAGAQAGMTTDFPSLSWQRVSTDGYGGAMVCAFIASGPGTMCTFADATTFGMTLVEGSSTRSLALARQLRDDVEAQPAVPAPEVTPETGGGTDAGGGQPV